MTTHQQARVCIRYGFSDVFGREPTLLEAQFCQAVGVLETHYGDGWGVHDTGFQSNNIGAVQAGTAWTGETFEHKDSSPQPDGSSKWYLTKFRKYPTLQDGFTDLVRAVYKWRGREKVLIAATMGDVYAFSAELHASGYYEGFGASVKQRIANHHRAVMVALHQITQALDEFMPEEVKTDVDLPRPLPPTLMMGSKGEAVKVLQRKLGVKEDGVFGPITRAAVVMYQKAKGLTPDGWVGAQTWGSLGP